MVHSLLASLREKEIAIQYVRSGTETHIGQYSKYYAEGGRAEAVENRLSCHEQHVRFTPTTVLVLIVRRVLVTEFFHFFIRTD